MAYESDIEATDRDKKVYSFEYSACADLTLVIASYSQIAAKLSHPLTNS